MNRIVLPGIAVLMAAALWGCGPGDDKGKDKDKKVEPAPPPKATTAPPKPEPAKPAPKKSAEAPNLGEGWVLLGQQEVDQKSEKERIRVGTTQARYKELRVAVQGAPVKMESMVVTFGNDEQFKPGLRQDFKDGTSSRAIDLPGEQRAIKNVEFVYHTSPGAQAKAKATVYLYGR